MHPYNVLHPTPLRNLKRTVADLECDAEPATKRTWLSSDHSQIPPYSTQDGHTEQLNCLCEVPNWRQCLKSSLVRPHKLGYLPASQELTANPRLSAWLDAVPYPRTYSCPASPRISPLQGCPFQSDPDELKRPRSCEALIDLVRHHRPATGSFSKPQGARLTLMALQKMSQQDSEYAEKSRNATLVSSNKAPTTSDAAYIDTLYGHGIVIDLSGRKIPKELTLLKERILQKRSSPQLDNQATFTVMDVAEELAYSSEGPTNKVLRTPMLPLGYGGLIEGGNTRWNAVAMPHNPQCDDKLSAPKPDAYLAYPRGSRTPWTVEQYNVANHPRVRPYSQPGERSTFPNLSLELKAECTGGALTTAEAQAAGSGSHCVNSILWLLEEAKAAGLTGVDLMQDTVSFSIVASHRQAVAYLHWLDPKEKRFYMSYLKSYSTFEADDIRACNNTVKNIIDNAQGPRKIKIGAALVALAPIKDSWSTPYTSTNPPTPNTSSSDDPRPRKRGRDLQA